MKKLTKHIAITKFLIQFKSLNLSHKGAYYYRIISLTFFAQHQQDTISTATAWVILMSRNLRKRNV